MLRTPYLPGESDMDQLKIIFRALGTPTEEEWPVSLRVAPIHLGLTRFIHRDTQAYPTTYLLASILRLHFATFSPLQALRQSAYWPNYWHTIRGDEYLLKRLELGIKVIAEDAHC